MKMSKSDFIISDGYLKMCKKLIDKPSDMNNLNEYLIEICNSIDVEPSWMNRSVLSDYIKIDLTRDFNIFDKVNDKILMTAFVPHTGKRNGYIGVNKNSNLFGVQDMYMPKFNIHGGLTYSRVFIFENEPYWVFGFDTNHIYSGYWSEQMVEKEVINLFKQVDKYEKKYNYENI